MNHCASVFSSFSFSPWKSPFSYTHMVWFETLIKNVEDYKNYKIWNITLFHQRKPSSDESSLASAQRSNSKLNLSINLEKLRTILYTRLKNIQININHSFYIYRRCEALLTLTMTYVSFWVDYILYWIYKVDLSFSFIILVSAIKDTKLWFQFPLVDYKRSNYFIQHHILTSCVKEVNVPLSFFYNKRKSDSHTYLYFFDLYIWGKRVNATKYTMLR